jgi:DNA-binding Lrp family transcriptional regulator
MSDHLTFISYSHVDRSMAEAIANSLNDSGIPVWWDQWDIQPGDSLISKIFEHGFSKATHFIVLLTPASVDSSWVKEELSIATIRRIEEMVRVIPVLVKDAEIPSALRSLFWVDLRSDFETGVNRIKNVILGISEKPPKRQHPEVSLVKPIEPYSKAATAIGNLFLCSPSDVGIAHTAFRGKDISDNLKLPPETVNDALDELEASGLVRAVRTPGSNPFNFFQAEPTYVLYREFKSILNYDPDEDIKQVATAVAACDQVDGRTLAQQTGLEIDRINLAVDYLDDYGIVKVLRFSGTSPFTFGSVLATSQTRRFAEKAC